MLRIIKIGMDVHSTNYTLCAVEPVLGSEDIVYASTQVSPDYKLILSFINQLKVQLGLDNDYDIVCGYEAGCLGYTLYNQLHNAGVKCVILAPSTMLTPQGKRIKTDTRDARMIAGCLAHGGYHPVYVPDEQDDEVKMFIRMRDDHCAALRKLKQQINAFVLYQGHYFKESKWTVKHTNWLYSLKLSALERETLNEYLASYEDSVARIARFDARIQEIAVQSRYQERVSKLTCFLGVKTHTALALIVEISDFNRFAKASNFASFLGLVPGEDSSSVRINRTGITKAGNSHLRKLLIEASNGIAKGRVGYVSKSLRARQNGNTSEVVDYANRGNTRLRRNYYHLIRVGKARNVAIAAVARELACFIWGMMTENMQQRPTPGVKMA